MAVSAWRFCFSAYVGRLDLDEADGQWIADIRNSGTTSLRRRHLGRLRRCCIQLGLLEADAAAA